MTISESLTYGIWTKSVQEFMRYVENSVYDFKQTRLYYKSYNIYKTVYGTYGNVHL
jgi:hypothetical protein